MGLGLQLCKQFNTRGPLMPARQRMGWWLGDFASRIVNLAFKVKVCIEGTAQQGLQALTYRVLSEEGSTRRGTARGGGQEQRY